MMIYLFGPYLLYLLVFILYATYFSRKMDENGDERFENFGWGSSISMVFTVLFAIYFAIFEVRQMIFMGFLYFKSFWNFIDILSIGLNILIILLDLIGLKDSSLVPILACAVLLMWLKLFYFGRIFVTTASMIRMIIEISLDMRYFLLILILTIAGFGN